MKKTNIAYWIVTVLFAGLMLFSAIPDILMDPLAVQGMHVDLGYPKYFIPFIGVAKVLGVLALFIPGDPRVREWAYAGLVFDLIGATYSIIASGKLMDSWGFMILPLALAFGSYFLHHKRLRRQQKEEPAAYGHWQLGRA
ncbi:MAG TPA: DoxX family protein [Chitinophagaceae bacterium]|nr:DoxX family protein [Chitinophagaceae bacterium]